MKAVIEVKVIAGKGKRKPRYRFPKQTYMDMMDTMIEDMVDDYLRDNRKPQGWSV